MKKILETKKDYEKLQQPPRPGEKVRRAFCRGRTHLEGSPHLLGREDRKLGAPPVCPGWGRGLAWGLGSQGQRPVLL